MSEAAAWLQKAMQSSDPTSAERYLIEALRFDPDLAQAYALRARLAVMRGDCVAAGHHFRVAFARGDRTPETRFGLATCLNAVGQTELAGRVGEAVVAPNSLADLPALAEMQSQPLRAMMGAAMAPRGTLALMPGERLPPPISAQPEPVAPTRPTAEQTSVQPPRLPLPAVTTLPGGMRPQVVGETAAPAAPAPPVPVVPAPAAVVPATVPPVQTVPAMPAVQVARRPLPSIPVAALPPLPVPPSRPAAMPLQSAPPLSLPPPAPLLSLEAAPPSAPILAPAPPPALLRRRLPEWIDQFDRSPIELDATSESVDWIAQGVEDLPPIKVTGGIELTAEAGEMEVTNDPGIPQIAFLSPVTGRIVLPDEVERERKEGRMPELERAPDLLGRSSIFADLVDTRRLVLAIDLPGPVLTAPNVPPRPLCRLMIFGATPDELIFRDAEKLDAPPVRLPRSSLARMDVVNDDQQISFLLGDGRQIHLDLRTLSRTHASTVRALVRRLRELVDSGR